MPTLTISGKELRAALESLHPMAAYPGSGLPLLSSLHLTVKRGKATLHATDRYRVGEWTLTTIRHKGVMAHSIPLRDAKRVLNILPGYPRKQDDTEVTITAGTDRITFENEHGDRVVTAVEDGKYPDLASLFPAHSDGDSLTTITLNPGFLEGFAAAQRRISRWRSSSYGAGMRMTFTGANKGVLVEFQNVDEFRGLLMPMRDDR